jgi:hypothetical protein
MSRNASRRGDVGITSGVPSVVQTETEPRPADPEAAEARPGLNRGWIVVGWLWPACFLLLALAEVGMFVFRKLTN